MKKNDTFARIAAMGISNDGKGLITPQPSLLEERYFYAEGIDENVVFSPQEKIHDKEGLYREVEQQKEYYRPFFKDYAPKLEEKRDRFYLNKFQWRIQTQTDMQNFSDVLEGRGTWEQIELPHYGEPRGVAVTYYRTTFTVASPAQDESLWVIFRGVDDKAHVFLNGRFLGSHEGFFAPFEFEFTAYATPGENVLVVMVENDYIHMGSCSEFGGEEFTGDKFYAATGLGYDEANEGWHHCPPGMGIYQDVFIERRKRMFISDMFVRIPQEDTAEVWLELFGCDVGHHDIRLDLSIYGQNFEETVLEHMIYEPCTGLQVGVGDSFTEARMKSAGMLGKGISLKMERGINYLKIPVSMQKVRQWELSTPWLYQLQVRLLDNDDVCIDTGKTQFGIRDFKLDEKSAPKGKFYLNGSAIHLRGANSMGFEQQCVLKKDWEQLYTDLILAKVCNMNFLRMTQRPVQEEVYDYCDKLGLMLQTDLPAFGAIRRNKFAEGLKQVQEMEHLIRPHPSAVLVSYINEPMPNAKNMPHRCLTRQELEDFFTCADLAIKILNPDRAIKHVDGDYDPPTAGLPDNHCYPCWYNGHGIDIGMLHKGYWMKVKDGWNYGCGEYGIEGLEELEVMKKYYPEDWLPKTAREEYDWTPGKLVGSQSGNFHRFFYDTQHCMEDWIRESQKYQAEAVKLMTEAYRRDSHMVTFAYHLFIDAFPEGWTKAIMDVDRNPKQAFFAYRDALTPLMVNLRTDRFKFFSGETAKIECWICNDTLEYLRHVSIHYQILINGKIVSASKVEGRVDGCDSRFQGFISFPLPEVKRASDCKIQAALIAFDGSMLHSTELSVELFPQKEKYQGKVCMLGTSGARWENFHDELGWNCITLQEVQAQDTIIVAGGQAYVEKKDEILTKVHSGARLLMLELEEGSYDVGESQVVVKNCSMLPLHFASRNTGHKLVDGMSADAIRYWYDEEKQYITPLLDATFVAENFREIAVSTNQDENGSWQQAMAIGECSYGAGKIAVCQVKLAGRVGSNPTARELALRLMNP